MRGDRLRVEFEVELHAEAKVDATGREVNPAGTGELTVLGHLDGQRGDPRHPAEQPARELRMQVLHDEYGSRQPAQAGEKRRERARPSGRGRHRDDGRTAGSRRGDRPQRPGVAAAQVADHVNRAQPAYRITQLGA